MKTASLHKKIATALLVALLSALFAGNAHAAQIARRVVVIIPPPTVASIKSVVSR